MTGDSRQFEKIMNCRVGIHVAVALFFGSFFFYFLFPSLHFLPHDSLELFSRTNVRS